MSRRNQGLLVPASKRTSDPSVSDQKPILGGIAERYATALFELAEDANAHDQVNADLSDLRAMIEQSRDLSNFIRSPLFSRDEHTRGLGAILDQAGASALTKQFVGTVAQKRRLFALVDIIRAYGQMLAKARGEATAQVISAHTLSADQLSRLAETLKAQLGSDVSLETSVDESLLGGLVVKVGSRMIDSSIRTKLNRLQLNLKEAS